MHKRKDEEEPVWRAAVQQALTPPDSIPVNPPELFAARTTDAYDESEEEEEDMKAE